MGIVYVSDRLTAPPPPEPDCPALSARLHPAPLSATEAPLNGRRGVPRTALILFRPCRPRPPSPVSLILPGVPSFRGRGVTRHIIPGRTATPAHRPAGRTSLSSSDAVSIVSPFPLILRVPAG
jgi:hypothetical protein